MPVQSFYYYRGSGPALSRKRGEQMYQLDLHSRAPIYQQLKEKILRLIMAGAIGPGDPLPSVRVMARDPNTVAKAYQDLEKSGLIYSVAGKGSFISGEETLDRQVAVSVLDHLREAIREARSSGVDRQTALILIDEVYKEGNAQSSSHGI